MIEQLESARSKLDKRGLGVFEGQDRSQPRTSELQRGGDVEPDSTDSF